MGVVLVDQALFHTLNKDMAIAVAYPVSSRWLIAHLSMIQRECETLPMYRIGWLGWKLAARCGFPLTLRVHIHFDPEVSSYWTSSPDLGGLIVTGATLDELFKEVELAAPDLIELELGRPAALARTTFTPVDRIVGA